MWPVFCAAALACLVVLYLPGFLFLKGLRFSGIISFAAAPAISVGLLAGLPIAFQKAGVACNFVTVGVSMLVLCACVWAISAVAGRNRETAKLRLKPIAAGSKCPKVLQSDWVMAALYVLIGMVVCLLVFVVNLGSPDAILCHYDNQTHLNTVRSFLDSGVWSSLVATNYLGVPSQAIPYAQVGSFYPSAWHALVAFTCSATGASVPLATNAVNTALAGFVYPASAFLMVRSLFQGNRLATLAGAVVANSFLVLPWTFFHWGPLVANLLGDAIVPAAIGVLAAYGETNAFKRKPLACALFAVFALVSMALAHPNTVFTLFVFAVPYIVHVVWRHISGSARFTGSARKSMRWAVCIAICVVAVALWIICVNLPFMKSVVGYSNTGSHGVAETFVMLASMKLGVYKAQLLLSVFAIVGVVACLRRKCFWMLVPVLFMAVAFVMAMLPHTPVREFVSGFWYNHNGRIAACLALFLIPVISLGLSDAARWVTKKLPAKSERTRLIVGPVLVIGLFALIGFFPNVRVPGSDRVLLETPFGHVADVMYAQYHDQDQMIYDDAERAFVKRVAEEVPAGAVVLNQPNDGSVWAYADVDLNTYWRYISPGQTDASKTIRKKLNEYATNDKVKAAVEHVGAEYLLQLDQAVPFEEGVWLAHYKKPEQWKGIDAVRDDTPGFTVVLAEGDMRLYKIG